MTNPEKLREIEKADISKGNKKYGANELDNIISTHHYTTHLLYNSKFCSNSGIYGIDTFDRDSNTLYIVECLNDLELIKNTTNDYVISTNNFLFLNEQLEELSQLIQEHTIKRIYIHFHLCPYEPKEQKLRYDALEEIAKYIYGKKFIDCEIYLTDINSLYPRDPEHRITKSDPEYVNNLALSDKKCRPFEVVKGYHYSVLTHFALKHFSRYDKEQNLELLKRIINSTKCWLNISYIRQFISEIIDKNDNSDFYKKLDPLDFKGFNLNEFRFNYLYKDSYKELYKELETPPTPRLIRDEVLKRHTLIHLSNKLGFFEYDNSIWRSIDSTQVKRYAKECFSDNETNKALYDSVGLIQVEVHNEYLEFNKKPLIVLNNGTIDLNNNSFRTFRPSLPSDYATVKLNVDYNENITISETMYNVISDILGKDEVQIKQFQKMLGYSLLPHHLAKKFFFIQGDTNSGKTALTKIVNALFGDSNCSNKTIRDLGKQHHLMSLENSFVNIDDDDNATDFTVIENRIKNIVVGETVEDSEKYQKVRKFTPRAKWLITSNHNLTSTNQFPEAMLTRLVEFKTPMKFVPYEPRKANEIKLRPRLIDNLINNPKELTGLLNWALEGAEMVKNELLANRDPFYTVQNEQRKNVIRNKNNAMATFIKTFSNDILKTIFDSKKRSINQKQLLELFKSYCDKYNFYYDSGKEKSYKTQIGKEIVNIFTDIEKYKTGGLISFRLKKNVSEKYKTLEEYKEHLTEIQE